jgi:hypothetical protein
MQQHWWISHSLTGKLEREGGFLLAPRTPRYAYMQEMQVNDTVFSYDNRMLRRGRVVRTYYDFMSPPGFEQWPGWNWRVDVEFDENPVVRILAHDIHQQQIMSLQPLVAGEGPFFDVRGCGTRRYVRQVNNECCEYLNNVLDNNA